MKHLLLFRKDPIDIASAVEDSTGLTVDFLAVPFENLVNISATYAEVILYIKEANTFENSKANLAQVVLAVDPTREIETVKKLWTIIREDNSKGYIEFNSPIRQFPVEYIREITSIKRFTTERFTSSGGSLPAGGVVDQVLTKQSTTDGDADWEYPHTLYVTVRNVSGGTLAKGTPVHANDVTGEVADVIAADASSASAMPCTYVLNEEIDNNQQGIAILTGTITGVDTSSFSPGDVIYVASGGGFTNVKPTGTNLIQNLGVVTKSNASTGSGVVYGTGRSNDVPNLPTGKFFIGSASNTQESAYTLPTADGSANQVLTTDGAGAVTFQTAGGGDEYIQFNGSANNGNFGADRYIPLGGNYVDTSSIQVYSEAMCPFNGVVESITVRTDNASGSTTTKLWVNGTAVNSSTDTLSANTPLTIAFGDSVSTGDLIACSMNTTSAAGDSYVTVLIKKS